MALCLRSSSLCFAFVLALFCLPSLVFAGNGTRTVEGEAHGRYYNELLKRWSVKPIVVYVDNGGNFYVSGGDKLIGARAYLKLEQLRPLINALKKGLEWAPKAKEAKLEVTKELGAFTNPSDHHTEGIWLSFFSANKGEQTDVIMEMVDFDNQFEKITLYLEPIAIPPLVNLLEKVPATIDALKEQEKKADILK